MTGPDGLPLEQVNGSTVLYYYQDQLGSTRALLDGSGKTQATYTYGVYGNVTAHTGSVSNPFQFAGQYTDSESGLQYLRNRYYDPSTAQFLTVDPLVGMTQQPYSYANDDPLNGSDPAGLASISSDSPPCQCARAQAEAPAAGSPLAWLYDNAGHISAAAAVLAVLAAVALGPEAGAALIVAFGLISFATGIIAAIKDFREGNYWQFALDIIGVVGGGFSLGMFGVARALAAVASDIVNGGADTVRGLQAIVDSATYPSNASRSIEQVSDMFGEASAGTAGAAEFGATFFSSC